MGWGFKLGGKGSSGSPDRGAPRSEAEATGHSVVVVMPGEALSAKAGHTGSEAVQDRDAGAEPSGFGASRRELEELILKLDLIEKECVEEKLNEEKEAMKDEFIILKRETYKILVDVNDLIRTRHQIQKQSGNTVEVIQKGEVIRRKIDELDSQFGRMKDVFKRQTKQRRKKFTDEQLDQRFSEMQVIKQQIEASRSMFKNAGAYSTKQIKTLTDIRSQLKREGMALPAAAQQREWRELNADEQGALDRWRERDADIDQQVEEIGTAVDRLTDIAIQIGEKADKQSRLVANLHQQADHTNEELLAVNNKIKEVLVKQGGMNLVCKLVLSLILVGIIALLVTTIKSRFFS